MLRISHSIFIYLAAVEYQQTHCLNEEWILEGVSSEEERRALTRNGKYDP